jgi:hypothetical protein
MKVDVKKLNKKNFLGMKTKFLNKKLNGIKIFFLFFFLKKI